MATSMPAAGNGYREGDYAGRRLHGVIDWDYTTTALYRPELIESAALSIEQQRLASGLADIDPTPHAGLDGYNTSSIYMGGPPDHRRPATTVGREAMRWWREGLRQVRRPPAVATIVRFAGGNSDAAAAAIYGRIKARGLEEKARLPAHLAFDSAAGRASTRVPVLFTLQVRPPAVFAAASHAARSRPRF